MLIINNIYTKIISIHTFAFDNICIIKPYELFEESIIENIVKFYEVSFTSNYYDE